ncbi:MAG: DUF167 domain-containing protein [Elusimicrobia bacterium]|nr:DUF167 domain-containing protein [Elusimicrobiota bacterium]
MLIKLKVHADSKSTTFAKKSDDSYEIWVRAPAERGLANKAALNVLAEALNQNAGRLRIIKGSQSPNKIVKIL